MSEVGYTSSTQHMTNCGRWKIEDDGDTTWLQSHDMANLEFDDLDDAKELHAALTKYIELREEELKF